MNTVARRGGRKPIDPESLQGRLSAMRALAVKADKLEARAKELRRKADAAAMLAGEARDELASRMRELSS